MDRNEARKAAEVMLAYADGKEIEWSPKDRDGRWIRANDPGFDWVSNDYHIKPQPKYRPFNNAEECWQEMQKHQPFGWVKDKELWYQNIVGIMSSTIWLAKIEDRCIDYLDAFEKYTFADGSAFGVKEEA